MTTSDPLLLQSPSPYDQPKLKSLPLREQPAYRVSQNAAACNLSELLAAVIGGPKQIEIAESLLTRFGGDTPTRVGKREAAEQKLSSRHCWTSQQWHPVLLQLSLVGMRVPQHAREHDQVYKVVDPTAF